MYRTLLGLIACLLAALALVGVTFSRSRDRPADFRFMNGAEPRTLDPHLATGQPEGRILLEIFEGLTRRDPKTLETIPGVAQRWELSADAQRYTFHLRDDARWTDGRPVTALDFVYAWKRLLDPGLGAEYAYVLYTLRHGEAYHSFAGHLEALRGPITRAIAELAQRGTPLPAADWQRALAQANAFGALQHIKDAALTRWAGQKQGALSTDDLRAFLQGLERETQRLQQELADAQAHLGVDQGVFAPDARTLVVELRAPTPYFLEITSFYPTLPVPRQLLEQPGQGQAWFLPETIVSNGPFVLRSWAVNDRIRLQKNPSYWARHQVRLESVDALVSDSATTALNLYLTGALDWLPSFYPQDLVHRLRQRPDFYSGPAMTVYYYRINCERGPFRDSRVRKALNLAIDRSTITEQVLGLGQLPAGHFVPPGIPGYTSPPSGIKLDVAEARRLLAEAGFADGKGFPEFGILYNTLEAHKKIAEVIADQLRRNLNLQANAYNQEWQSYLETTRRLDYDLARAAWVGDYLDPNTFLDIWVTNGGNNATGYSSADYDSLIRAAGNVGAHWQQPEAVSAAAGNDPEVAQMLEAIGRAESPEAKARALEQARMKLLQAAERLIVEQDFPIIPIYFYVNSGLVSPKLRGFYAQLELQDGTRLPNLEDHHPLYALEVPQEGK